MERLALARALRQHLHHQVMVYRGRPPFRLSYSSLCR